MKLHFSCLVLLVAGTSVAFGQDSPGQLVAGAPVAFDRNGSGHIAGRILVQRVRKADEGAVGKAYQAHGAKVLGRLHNLDVDVLTVPEAAVPRIMQSLAAKGLFTFIEADGIAKGGSVPNDPNFPSQWHLSTINGPGAWDISNGSTKVPIAMIDSGVNPSHPDLISKLIPGYSFLNGSTNTADVQGHGTATAGTAAAASNNGTGGAGVAGLSPIMPLVVLDATDYASYSNIASAITYAADHGVRIINISIGGTSPSSTLQSAVNYAWNKGAVIFASAMNSSSSTPYYPAACDNVIAVSSTEPNDTLSSFSNYGSWIDLSAPGNNILTTNNSGGYSYWAGTSFSSPIAAGTAALALSINPLLSAQGLVNLLEQNADDLGASGWDPYFGWGRVNAYRVAVAAKASISSDTTPPVVKIATPTAGSQATGTVTVSGSATDNINVSRVELWVDGTLGSTCSSASFMCSWNTAAYASGNHTVTVKAYDNAGNMGSAAEAVTIPSISIPDVTNPTVQITSPTNGSSVSGNLRISVSAGDNVGIRQVSIFIDGSLKTTLTSGPYNFTWNTNKVQSGYHTISAQAWDGAGNTASTSVTVRR